MAQFQELRCGADGPEAEFGCLLRDRRLLWTADRVVDPYLRHVRGSALLAQPNHGCNNWLFGEALESILFLIS
jgi:hypothetical protein